MNGGSGTSGKHPNVIGFNPQNRLEVAASLLWSWLCEARRKWALEHECIMALMRFKQPAGGCLSEEEARAAFVVAVEKLWIAVDDDRARSLYRASMGLDPEAVDAIPVRARTTNQP